MLFLFRISQTVRESQSSSFAVILSEISLKKQQKQNPTQLMRKRLNAAQINTHNYK